jgi:hypothetical protein
MPTTQTPVPDPADQAPEHGSVIDYVTRAVIRPATAEDLKRTEDKLNSGDTDAYTGTWTDDSGRTVFVDD